MNYKNSIRPAQHEPLQHESPPEPKEPGELGLGLSEDDASLQTRMKEEPLVNGMPISKLEEKMDIIRNNLHSIQSRVPEKAKKGKTWYYDYGPPKHTQEDQFKKIALGAYTDPRTRTRRRRSKYSLPPEVVRDVNTPKKNPLEEKHKRPSRAKHPKAKRGRPPKKKLPILVNNFTDSALEHNYLDATEKKKLSKRLEDILKKIPSDTNSSLLEDIKNVVHNELFKGISNYNISGDYSKQENNLIEEVRDIMKEIRPYVLVDENFLEHIEAVIQKLQLDPYIPLEESTPEYDPHNRIFNNPKFNENDFFDDMNQIRQNNNNANRTKNTNNRQLPSSYAHAPRVQSEEKKVPKLLITYPKLLEVVSRGLIDSSRLDALDLNNTEELTEILNEVEQIIQR